MMNYNFLVNSKLVIAYQLLKNGYNIIFNDDDIVWLLTLLGSVVLCRTFVLGSDGKRLSAIVHTESIRKYLSIWQRN